jgi:hypothetical protein
MFLEPNPKACSRGETIRSGCLVWWNIGIMPLTEDGTKKSGSPLPASVANDAFPLNEKVKAVSTAVFYMM